MIAEYRIGGVAVADTIDEAIEQREAIQRVAGRSAKTITIELRATGEIVTRRMAAQLREDERNGAA